MSDKLRVYVAGPITKGDLQHNIEQARVAGRALMAAGFAPMVPHLTCFMGPDNVPEALPNGTKAEDWYGIDLPWVAVCDAVVRLPGESVGADKETELATRLGIPVYHSVENLIAAPPVRGDSRFHRTLRLMGSLHDRKQRDYGSARDPFANVRASEEIGIPAWKGAWLRARDKVKRIDTFCVKGTLANEGVVDSFLDLAVYSIICKVLFDETAPESAA
jgi:hypothetical protein